MKKKNLLAMAVFLSVLQGSSCFAGVHQPEESILQDGIYNDFIESTRQSIILHEKYNNKDAVYTFEKGASIAIDGPYGNGNGGYAVFNPISNTTDNSLTINVGGELDKDGKRYEFYLKPQNFTSVPTVEYKEPSSGIMIGGNGKDNRINLNNTNMSIDLSNDAVSGINVGYQKNGEDLSKCNPYLYISANNSDINIVNESDTMSDSAISVSNNGKLEIKGNGNSDINILGNIVAGIKTDCGSNILTISDINDLKIIIDAKESLQGNLSNKYGVYMTNEKLDLNLSGNLIIGTQDNKGNLNKGIMILDSPNQNTDFDLHAGGDISIKNVCWGIYLGSRYEKEGKTHNIDITSDSLEIQANDVGNTKGIGIRIEDLYNLYENTYFNLTTNKGMHIVADTVGYNTEGAVQSKLTANNGSINIEGEKYGILMYSDKSTEGHNVQNNTDIVAGLDIIIKGNKYSGIESLVDKGELELKAGRNIVITSEQDAFKHGHVYNTSEVTGKPGELEIGVAQGEILAKLTAKENILLSGKETGLKYATVNSGKAQITSNEADVRILGETNGIYLDSQDIDGSFYYDGKGNIGKHDISVKADKGSVYIGAFGKDGEIIGDGNGIYNTGRNILNVEANDLVAIQGKEAALYAKKETNNIIKAKNIVLKSDYYALLSEGVNNVVLGYEEGDNKVTDYININGASSGLHIYANTRGKDDVKDGYYSKDNPDILIDGETNSTKLYANNFNISGEGSGISIYQEATEYGYLEEDEIYTKWKNNVVDINGNGIVNIVSEHGIGINVNGINKVNIKNTDNNTTIKGGYYGVNLRLASDFNADNGVDYTEKVFDYINRTAFEAVRANNYSHISVEQWNTTQREQYHDNYEKKLLENSGYSSLADYYKDLLTGENSEALQQDIKDKINCDITPEKLQAMKDKYQDDPVKGLLFAQLSDSMAPDSLDDLFSTLNKTRGEVLTEQFLQDKGLATLKDYFDQLVAQDKLESVNYNIDVKDEFNLETRGTNTILGGANAFNIDGKLHALVKGDVNYFSSSNYRQDDLGDEKQSSVAVNIVNKGDFRAEGNTNIVEAGKIDDKGFGNETSVKVQDGGKAVFVAKDGDNRLSGAVFVGNAGNLEVTSNGGNNTILSSTHGTNETTNDVNVVNAVFATGKDSAIKIDAGTAGVNNIATDVQVASSNQDGREITVWAHDGAGVNINGAVNISASNGANYVNAAKGNALGVAVSAGGRVLQYDGSALKPIDNISKVDINYTSDVKNSFISGDIVAGYGGQVDIHSDKAKDNSLAVNGNILAANNGVTNVDFGNGGSWIGRADDYFAADKKGTVDFFAPAFSDAIKEEGKVNVTMNNGMWSVTGQSWLTSFTGGNNTIDMVNFTPEKNNSSRTNAVAIQSMNGENNKFIMSLDNVNRNDSDMLYIKDGNATINVEVNGTINGLENVSQENGLRFATVGEGIKLDKIAFQKDGKAFVRGKDGGFFDTKLYVERQDYDKNNEYNDAFNGKELNASKPGTENVENLFGDSLADADNLVIVKVEGEGMSDAGSTVLDLSKVNYSNAVYMDRFNKRMGEARFIDGDEGIWVRMRHDRIGKDNAFRSNNTMYEIGYDAKQLKEDGEHRVGFAMDYMDGSSSFSKVSGSGEVNRKGLWMYDSWIGEKGHYRDLVAKWGHLSNDFEFMSGAGEATGEFANNVYSVSAEFGKKNDIGNHWYFEPQAQLQYAHVTGSDYVTTMDGADQTQIRNDAFNSLIARAGFRIGKDVDAKSTVYIKADVMHEFLGEQDVFANDGTTSGEWAKASYDHGGTWYDLGFGYSTKLNEASYVYLDVETSFGNDYEDSYQINAGVQWSF